jgi:hypothetical protein
MLQTNDNKNVEHLNSIYNYCLWKVKLYKILGIIFFIICLLNFGSLIFFIANMFLVYSVLVFFITFIVLLLKSEQWRYALLYWVKSTYGADI